MEHVLLDDGDTRFASGWELGAQVGYESWVELDGDNMGGASGQGASDGSGSGANFDDGAPAQVAKGCGDPIDGLRIVEEVLSEPGFDGHVLL
jgi:hypothetical protein